MRLHTVYTEITNRCNLNCSTCYNRSGKNDCTVEISIKQIKQIMQICSRYGAKRFLFSGGEPLLHSHFFDLLKLIRDNPQFDYGFVTNGTLHDAEWVNFLNSQENVTIQISLDGASEETNRLTRGPYHFNEVLSFVGKLHLPRQKPLLKMVVSQHNIGDVEAFYRLAVSLKCMPEFAFIYKSGNGTDNWENKALSAQQKLSVLRLVRELNKEYNLEAYLPKCTVGCPYTKDAEHMSICIKTNGDIQPCQVLYSEKFSIGNIFDFQEDKVLARVNDLLILAQKRLSENYGCEKCILNKGCGRGCLAEAVNNFGDPLAEDGNCLFRKLQFLDMYVTNK